MLCDSWNKFYLCDFRFYFVLIFGSVGIGLNVWQIYVERYHNLQPTIQWWLHRVGLLGAIMYTAGWTLDVYVNSSFTACLTCLLQDSLTVVLITALYSVLYLLIGALYRSSGFSIPQTPKVGIGIAIGSLLAFCFLADIGSTVLDRYYPRGTLFFVYSLYCLCADVLLWIRVLHLLIIFQHITQTSSISSTNPNPHDVISSDQTQSKSDVPQPDHHDGESKLLLSSSKDENNHSKVDAPSRTNLSHAEDLNQSKLDGNYFEPEQEKPFRTNSTSQLPDDTGIFPNNTSFLLPFPTGSFHLPTNPEIAASPEAITFENPTKNRFGIFIIGATLIVLVGAGTLQWAAITIWRQGFDFEFVSNVEEQNDWLQAIDFIGIFVQACASPLGLWYGWISIPKKSEKEIVSDGSLKVSLNTKLLGVDDEMITEV